MLFVVPLDEETSGHPGFVHHLLHIVIGQVGVRQRQRLDDIFLACLHHLKVLTVDKSTV